MLKYSRSIRSPLTNIYMLGIVLPTLGLALLPLASTLLGGVLKWQHIMIIFNIIIPFLVFYMASEVLLKRPGGYGEASILELNPNYAKYKSRSPWILAALIAIPLLIIGLIPFLFQSDLIVNTLGLQKDYTFEQIGIGALGETKLFDFKTVITETGGRQVGPFGPLAVLLSLFIPISIGLFFSIAYSMKTSGIITSRDKTKALESEFTNSLFQLGNRIGDGLPAEVAFGRVAETTRGQTTQNFFEIVNQNIQQFGMSVDRAIFDKRRGAIIYYPSALISTSMRVLVESVKKGLQVAARSLMSISDYVKNINKINQRLRDLLAEIISDMRSNMVFLAPLLSGIVVGLSTMITAILGKLEALQAGTAGAAAGGFIGNVPDIFVVSEMIPPYFIQIIIGIYIIEIIFILTKTLVTVNAGKDELQEKYILAKNLKSGMILYIITALVAILALTGLSAIALGGLS